MASSEMQNIINFMREMQSKATVPSAESMRTWLDQMAAMAPPFEGTTREAADADGVPAEWTSVPETHPDNVILYFHGGGYVAGSIVSHRDLVSRLAVETGRRVLAVDYRLAPENPFPNGLDDAVAAYRWLLDKQGIPAKNIVIGGDSAGGGLTMATLVRLKEAKAPMPRATFLLSPWTDLAITGESVRTKAKQDPFITPDGLPFIAGQYLQGTDPRNPLASPLYADLSGLPPLLIQVGECECLLDDSRRLAEKAKTAGVDVTIDVWDEMIHVFQAFAPVTEEGKAGIRRIAEYLNGLT